MKFHGIVRLKDGTKLKITAEDTEAYPIKNIREAHQALLMYPHAVSAVVLVPQPEFHMEPQTA